MTAAPARVAQAAPITNRLLDRLPAKSRARVLAGCEKVELAFGEILAEQGSVIRDVYFPTGSFVSLVAHIGAKSGLEVAPAGNEGILDRKGLERASCPCYRSDLSTYERVFA